MDLLILLLFFATGAVFGYLLSIKSIMAIWRAFLKLDELYDKMWYESLYATIELEKYKKQFDFELDKAYEKLKKKISEVDEDSTDLLPDVRSGLCDPALDKLPKIGNHKVHAPRIFTLKLKLKALIKLWKDLLK